MSEPLNRIVIVRIGKTCNNEQAWEVFYYIFDTCDEFAKFEAK